MENLARFDSAWAPGFFQGDGSTSNSIEHLKGGIVSCTVTASVSQSGPTGVPEVLERFRSVVGLGQIYGPIRWRNANEPGFEWTIQAYRDVPQFRAVLRRFMGPVKDCADGPGAACLRAEPAPPKVRLTAILTAGWTGFAACPALGVRL